MQELIFVTSNSAKLSHARHLCAKYAVRIAKQKNYGIGYVEPRIEDRDELIKKSVEDAIARFKKNDSNYENKFFFIEDTSVVIKSLSKEKEYPGVDIKYWMQEHSFNDVDKLLKNNGNDRSAIVRSDLILVLSSRLADQLKTPYKIFTSQIEGFISDIEYTVSTQPLYPWLSEKTFNKWFIPNGCSQPMSLLNITDADKYDFRAGAFNEMLTFLHKNHIILTHEEKAINGVQLDLFGQIKNFIVCGPTCAGKTTLASYLVNKYNYYHIEASDFMYLSFYERHGINSSVSIGDFAQDALRVNPAIVSDQIIQNIEKIKSVPLVITGFRDPKEIESFRSKYKGDFAVKLIYLDAEQTIRYQRYINRHRNPLDKNITLEEFKKSDKQQHKMGLPAIKKHIDYELLNNGSLEDHFRNFEKLYETHLLSGRDYVVIASPKFFAKSRLQNAIILTLLEKQNLQEYYTTTEIARLINANKAYAHAPKSKNNVSRYFNQNFHPYFDIKINDEGKACYRLSQTGVAYGNFLRNTLPTKQKML